MKRAQFAKRGRADCVNIRRKETSRSFDVARDLRQFTALLRLPILAMHPTQQPLRYTGWEQRQRVHVELRSRYRNSSRAITSDGAVLAYVAGAAMRSKNRSGTICPPHIDVQPGELLKAIGRPVSPQAVDEVICSFRRLTSTFVDLRNWGPDCFHGSFCLLEVQPLHDGNTYRLCLSDWLQEEIDLDRVVRIRPDGLALSPVQTRLYGWAAGWVGPVHGQGRVVRQREAVCRLGAVLPGETPWGVISKAVADNNLPSFNVALGEFEHAPAIFVERRGIAAIPFKLPELVLDLSLGGPVVEQQPTASNEVLLVFHNPEG